MIKGYILQFELKQLFLEKRRRRIETNTEGYRTKCTYEWTYTTLTHTPRGMSKVAFIIQNYITKNSCGTFRC